MPGRIWSEDEKHLPQDTASDVDLGLFEDVLFKPSAPATAPRPRAQQRRAASEPAPDRITPSPAPRPVVSRPETDVVAAGL